MSQQPTTNNQQPIILAIDTSTPALVIAIGQFLSCHSEKQSDEESRVVLASYSQVVQRNHLELIIPQIDDLMKKGGLKFENLSAIAVGLGPGSLIGARVGVVVAKTLTQVLKIDIIGISTLDATEGLYPTPEALIKQAFKKRRKGQVASLYDLEPIYLRKPV